MEKQRLNEWWMKNEPDEKLIYRDRLDDQCIFIRDRIMTGLFLDICTDFNKCKSFSRQNKIYVTFQPYIISTHYSKSVRLPVFELNLDKIGLKIILRDNFYDWCISVESENPIDDIDWLGLVDPRKKGYFEGFPQERIYEPYYADRNNKKFSIVLNTDYDLYTFMRIIRQYSIKKFDIKENKNED